MLSTRKHVCQSYVCTYLRHVSTMLWFSNCSVVDAHGSVIVSIGMIWFSNCSVVDVHGSVIVSIGMIWFSNCSVVDAHGSVIVPIGMIWFSICMCNIIRLPGHPVMTFKLHIFLSLQYVFSNILNQHSANTYDDNKPRKKTRSENFPSYSIF